MQLVLDISTTSILSTFKPSKIYLQCQEIILMDLMHMQCSVKWIAPVEVMNTSDP